MKKNILFYSFLLCGFLFSCQKQKKNEDVTPNRGTVTFGVNIDHQSSVRSGALRTSAANAASIIVTVEDEGGNVIVNRKELKLKSWNDAYISDPLILEGGIYFLTEFLVVDESDNVIYATPIEGSELAQLTDYTLPAEFIISPDNPHFMSPTVLPVGSSDAGDFGYVTFTFNIQETIEIAVAAFVFDSSAGTYNYTPANVVIKKDGATLLSKALTDSVNIITLADEGSEYEITVSKPGYIDNVQTFSLEELKAGTGTISFILEIGTLFGIGSGVTDVDGNNYATITVGNKEWMATNLTATNYANGDPIVNITDNLQWQTTTAGAWSYYQNDAVNNTTYGKLYNWYAVNDSRNICPNGWHVPNEIEWNALATVTAGKLKDIDSGLWVTYGNETNESGFSARPGGGRADVGSSGFKGYVGAWWTSDEVDINNAKGRQLTGNSLQLSDETQDKNHGVSIRCVKN